MRYLPVLALALVAACGDDAPSDKAAQDRRDVALVEQANKALPPVEEVVPEPIGASDLERFDTSGAACNYAPGTSFGTLVIARKDDAFVKIAGKVQRFAADPGASELPAGTRSLYNSRELVLKLAVNGGQKTAGTQQASDYEGSIALLDPHGRVVYQGSGLARCTA